MNQQHIKARPGQSDPKEEAPDRSTGGEAVKLSAFYTAYFAQVGIRLPFWPVWLAAAGMSSVELGIILSLGSWFNVVYAPILGGWADRRSSHRALCINLAFLSLVLFFAFQVAHGFWAIMLLNLVVGSLQSGVLVLGETLVVNACRTGRMVYGRIRVWGSWSFILVTILGGYILQETSPGIIFWLMAGSMLMVWVSCRKLPPAGEASKSRVSMRHVAWLIRRRDFSSFLIFNCLMGASHSMYYTFVTIHWQNQEITDTIIGILWALGVLAEIVVLYLAGPLLKKLGSMNLMLIGALAGCLRWSILAATSQIIIISLAQLLHAGTFGAKHLGTMAYLSEAVPKRLAATGVSLAFALFGCGMGLGTLAAGFLYDIWQGKAFYVMTLLSVLAAVAIYISSRLRARWA